MSVNAQHDLHPGAIVHTVSFPFGDSTGRGKPRNALVISANGSTVITRGIYTRTWCGRHPIRATYETGLDHDSYVDSQLVELPVGQLTHYVGEAPYDFDPFNDFGDLF